MENISEAKQKLQYWLKRNTEQTQKDLTQFKNDWSNLKDYKIPTNMMRFDYNDETNEIIHALDNRGIDEQKYKMTDNAINQLGIKLGIPPQFIKNNIESNKNWRKEMISYVLQKHVDNIRSAFIFRTVKNEIRGIVSMMYKRYDSMTLYNKFVSQGKENGLIAYYFSYDKYTTGISMIYPEPFEININGNKKYVMYGVKMRHGDFGNSALSIQSSIINIICSNGMIGESKLRKIHKGKRTKIEEEIISPETIKLETEAEISLMNDAIQNLMDTKNIEKFINEYEATGTMNIDLDHGYEKLKHMGMTKFETSSLQELMENRPKEADMNSGGNLYALIQGTSYMGRLKREKDKNLERSHDIEEMAYDLMKSYV
jgi:hypothetical protein